VPQIKKDCNISIEHPSYVVMERVFNLYKAPYLSSLLAQQIAYNCAIRKVYIDSNLENPFQDLTRYALNTFDDCKTYINFTNSDLEEILFANHSHNNLYLDYPFIMEIDKDDTLDVIDSYPNLIKPLNDTQLTQILKMQAANIENIYIDNTSQVDKNVIPFFSDGANKIAWNLTRAFYYFDCIHFYKCTQSMITRNSYYKDEKVHFHNNKTVKKLLSVIEPYILYFKYIDLI